MKAVVLHSVAAGPHVEDVEVLEPQAGEVVVRVAASGLCGSDLHVLHGRTVRTYPIVMGHEGAGIVEAVGPGVDELSPGDHVVLGLYGPCGRCRNCRTGNIVHCEGPARTEAIFGKMADGSTRLRQGDQACYPYVGIGSLAEYVVMRAAQVIKIDEDVPLDVIALAGCGVTTGLGAVFNTARVSPGDSVAVVGCGGVGLNVIQGARLAGATRIVAIDMARHKLDLAADLGATHLVDSSERPMRDAVLEIVSGGVDIAFEVVGNAQLVAETFELVRPGGLCVMVGIPAPGSVIPLKGESLFWERRVAGCIGGSNIPMRDIPRIVQLYKDGRLKLDELVSQRLPIERFDVAVAAAEANLVARSVITFLP
jgi:S-(hydroxymethyl)glutathione dehydrogenase/alcohol dehydrogenase